MSYVFILDLAQLSNHNVWLTTMSLTYNYVSIMLGLTSMHYLMFHNMTLQTRYFLAIYVRAFLVL